jgi:hypothetical protein
MSILSIDTLRSFSRTGFRQGTKFHQSSMSSSLTIVVSSPTSRDHVRSPSSLSYCDPHNQPPPTGVDNRPATRISQACSPYGSDDALTETTPAQLTNDTSKRSNRKSAWLPFGSGRISSSRSMSERLNIFRSQNPPTITRSNISAPVLSSTTNARVARTESVLCGELTQETFDKSTWDNKLGWVSTQDIPSTQQPAPQQQTQENDTKLQLKPTARLQRLRKALRSHFRREEKPDRANFDAIRNDENMHPSDTSDNQRKERYEAESTNLSRDKISKLTGNVHGSQRSQSTPMLTLGNVNNFNVDADAALAIKNHSFNAELPQSTEQKSGTFSHSNTSACNLNIAHNHAFDQTSTAEATTSKATTSLQSSSEPFKPTSDQEQSNITMDSLHKKVSQWRIRDEEAASPRKPTISAPMLIAGAPIAPSMATMPIQQATTSQEPAAESAAEPAAAAAKTAPAVKNLRFAPGKGGYIPAPPDRRHPGGVNPLGMHTNTMAFAEGPVGEDADSVVTAGVGQSRT